VSTIAALCEVNRYSTVRNERPPVEPAGPQAIINSTNVTIIGPRLLNKRTVNPEWPQKAAEGANDIYNRARRERSHRSPGRFNVQWSRHRKRAGPPSGDL
jgi:hypothetical protein